MTMKEIILEILNEIEKKDSVISIAGGRGYSAGKAYPSKSVGVLQLLGHEEGEKQEIYKFKPVEISKIFKKREKND